MLPTLEGGLASNNPRSSVVAGGGFFQAGEDGVVMCRFAWADPETGIVSNSRTSPAQLLGIVQPIPGYWRAMVRDGRAIRPGNPVTLYATGDLYVRFPAGAVPGDVVYASTLDGAPISGEATDAEPTPWFVVTAAAPEELALISTWSQVRT